MQLLAGCYFILRWRCGIKMYTGTHSIESSTFRAGAFEEGGAEREKKRLLCCYQFAWGKTLVCESWYNPELEEKRSFYFYLPRIVFYWGHLSKRHKKKMRERNPCGARKLPWKMNSYRSWGASEWSDIFITSWYGAIFSLTRKLRFAIAAATLHLLFPPLRLPQEDEWRWRRMRR